MAEKVPIIRIRLPSVVERLTVSVVESGFSAGGHSVCK